MEERLLFREVRSSTSSGTFCEAVREGLEREQKSIPSRYFYDARGSALFERITQLPEYYLTETETTILRRHADQIVESAGAARSIIEFGSGSSKKTRILLEAALRARRDTTPLHYSPIDISRDFLREASESLLRDYPDLRITAIASEYTDALRLLREPEEARMFVFLGSNIGNFEHAEAVAFLHEVRGAMGPEACLLMGADMVKDSEVIEAAYNDRDGATERFNKNILNRINRELDADFDPEKFSHAAPYLEEEQRVEMRLVARSPHSVTIDAIGRTYAFEKDEFIHTEYSQKYTENSLRNLCDEAGLRVRSWWNDDRRWFSLVLLEHAERA